MIWWFVIVAALVALVCLPLLVVLVHQGVGVLREMHELQVAQALDAADERV